MQVLRFIVKGQMIKKDPDSPFKKMVAGSSNYYIAEFDMDTAWTGYACLAHFTAAGADEVVPITQGRAMIPNSVLEYKTFDVSVIGQKNDSRLNTNTNRVIQIGGK